MIWLLLIIGLGLLAWAWQLRRQTGLPWQRVAYQDTGWQRNERPLIARDYGLIGKPDYLLETRHGLIPVEVKPSRRAIQPYHSDLMQLAAYCLLVEATTGKAPPYGLLRYAAQTFKLRYTAGVRQELLDLLAAIKTDRLADDVARSHNQAGRCRGCGFQDSCSEALA